MPLAPGRERRSARAATVALLLALVALLAGGPVTAARAVEAPTSAGVVQGIVRDTDGAPLSDVSVDLNTGTRDPATAGPGGSGNWYGDVRTETTDASGRYRFDGVRTPDDDHDVWGVSAHAEGYASAGANDLSQRLRTAPRTPADADLVLRRLDVTLRGRVSVRGGTPEGAWLTVTSAAPGANQSWFDSWSAWPDGDGRWELEVPAGAYKISAQSTYGLPTWWPDRAVARTAPVTRTARPGDVLDGLDISMRMRLPGPAIDEFGVQQSGWDSSRSQDPLGTYPRDTYRPPTSVRGPVASVGTPQSVYYSYPLVKLPKGDLVTVTGFGIPVEVPVTNTGDDLLWVDPPRLQGGIAAASTCMWTSNNSSSYPSSYSCDVAHPIEPGETQTVTITPVSDAWATEYPLTLTLPTSAGPDVQVPLRLRNVGWEESGADDHRNLRGIFPYLSDEDQARTAGFLGLGPTVPPEVEAWLASMAKPAAAPVPTPVKRAAPLGVVTVARTSVRFSFPAAGRVDVRIDRLIRSGSVRRSDRWKLARTVILKSNRAGVRSVRIKRLAIGPYRVRITAKIGGRTRRITDYRDVKP